MTGTIDVSLRDPGFLVFKSKARCRILIDGKEAGVVRIGASADFTVAAGRHGLSIVMEVGPITRRTRERQVLVADGETARLIGTYSRLWGKYSIAAAS